MASAAELQARLEKLKTARADGIRSVEYDGRMKVEFRTDAELRQAISDLQAEINSLENGAAPRSVVVRSTKGW